MFAHQFKSLKGSGRSLLERSWTYEELIQWFCDACFDMAPATHAAELLIRRIRVAHSPTAYDLPYVGVSDAATIAA